MAFKESRHRYGGRASILEIGQSQGFDMLSATSLLVAIFSAAILVEQIFPNIPTFQDPVWWADKVNRTVAGPLHLIAAALH